MIALSLLSSVLAIDQCGDAQNCTACLALCWFMGRSLEGKGEPIQGWGGRLQVKAMPVPAVICADACRAWLGQDSMTQQSVTAQPFKCRARAVAADVEEAGLKDRTVIHAPPLPISYGTHHRWAEG